jgi:hypothetical protein
MSEDQTWTELSVRDIASITVSKPVSGARKRRAPQSRKPRVAPVEHIKLHPLLQPVYDRMRAEGKRLVIVSETEFVEVNARRDRAGKR